MVWIMSIVGLAVLLVSGDLLVRGAVNLSLRLGVPALIVSLTIVAFGTSAPELLIAVNAVLNDASGIVLGNVVGSNIANVLLVLGVPALISTMNFQGCDVRRDYIVMLFATIAFIGLSYFGSLGLWQGAILLMILVCYLGYTVFSSAAPADNKTLEGQIVVFQCGR